jgi:WD40 repeat protein
MAHRIPCLLLLACAALVPGAPSNAQEKQPRLDLHGDPLPPGALARLGSSRYWHGLLNAAVAQSPDGKLLATGGHDYTIRLMDAGTGRELRRLGRPDGPQRPGMSLSFSPDSKTLAAGGGDSAIRLYEVATGEEIRQLQDGQHMAFSLTFSPNGKLLASGGMDGQARLWNVGTGTIRHRLAQPGDRLAFVAFSPDGKRLASTGTGMIHLWDVATGTALLQLRAPDEAVGAVAFTPDGKRLVAGCDEKLLVWDAATGKAAPSMGRKMGGVWQVAFSPDGKVVACGGGRGSAHLLELATGQEVGRFRGHLGAVCGLAFAPDGKTLFSAGSYDTTVRVWDVAAGTESRPRPGHASLICAAAFSWDWRTLFSYGWDGKLLAWDLATASERCLAKLPRHGRAEQAALSSDGKLFAVSDGLETIILRDVAAGTARQVRVGKQDCFALATNGRMLAALGDDKTVRLWDAATSKELRRLAVAHESMRGLTFSPDGKVLAALTDAKINVWDTATGRRHEWAAFDKGYTPGGVWFAPNGKTLVSCEAFAKPARFWDLATRQEIHRLMGQLECNNITFSPDGRLLAAVNGWSASPIRVFEMITGQEVRGFPRDRSDLSCLVFSPDCRVLATTCGGTILLWDLTGGPARGRLDARALERQWADLGDPTAKGYQALWNLSAVPQQALPLLRERLRPIPALDRKRVALRLTELASERFAVRDRAMHELEDLAELARPELRQALDRQPPLEVRRRVEQLLARYGPRAVPSGEHLRRLRAVAVLEYIGTAEARKLLAALATGVPEARQTQEARTALERLARRP